MITRILLSCFLYFLCTTGLAQKYSKLDELIKKNQESIDTNPSESLKYANEAYDLCLELNAKEKLGETANNLSQAYYGLYYLDSADKYVDIAMDYYEKTDEERLLTRVKVAKASILNQKGQKNEALTIYLDAISVFDRLNTINNLVDATHRASSLLFELDRLNEAMAMAKRTYDISLEHKKDNYAAYALNSMALVLKKQGDLAKAIEFSNQALEIYKAKEMNFEVMSTLNNIGLIQKSQGEFMKAVHTFKEALELLKKLDYTHGEIIILTNLADTYNGIGKYKNAEVEQRRALELANKISDNSTKAVINTNLGRSLLKQGYLNQAKQFYKEGLRLSQEIRSLEKQKDAHDLGIEIFKKEGNLSMVISEMQNSKMINDSIFSLEKAKQINELQTQYETEKKDAEIVVLAKTAELERTKKVAFLVGLIMLFLLASGIVYSLIQKRKKDQIIYAQERAIEEEKLRNTQLALESKQKELSSKMVQLAHKNEFLSNLEKEIDSLKSEVGSTVEKASGRISRMIRRDIVNDKQWEQFSEEFSSVHQGFLDALVRQFGSFSRSEIRLISLLKMNLTSKEISDVLGISDEGIRKARYRLRKKLNLSDTELQGYLLSYSGKA